MTSDDVIAETQVPCPACEGCLTCTGSGTPCAVCRDCDVCGGEKMVRQIVRRAWLEKNAA